MKRRFDATNENVKEMRGALSSIGRKVDVYAISVNHLEIQLNRFSTIVNPYQSLTIPSNTIKNQKIMGIAW